MKTILQSLSQVKDNRKNRGKRYRLESILGLVLTGYMSGCNNLMQVYYFGKSLSKTDRRKLGFKDKVPSHPTITETIKKIDPEEFESVVSKIVAQGIDKNFTQIALDGKSIRSTSSSKEGILHLISAFAPEVQGVISQDKSGVGGGEIKAADTMLSKLDIKGKVITGDALFAQEVLCNNIVKAGGDYLFKVKRNKKRIIEDITQGFEYYRQNDVQVDYYETVTKDHGRIDHRRIESLEVHRKYFGGWGLESIKQSACITRTRFNTKDKTTKIEKHYIISSLPKTKASAKDLLEFSVNHWSIENNLHRTRDTIFKEDVCNIICRKSQQINAAMRNLTIFLLHKIDDSITKAIRLVAGNIRLALRI